MTPERLQLYGKISLLQKEIKEIEIRIRNRQNTIRETTSLLLSIKQLGHKLENLESAVQSYREAFETLWQKQAEFVRLQEEL